MSQRLVTRVAPAVLLLASGVFHCPATVADDAATAAAWAHWWALGAEQSTDAAADPHFFAGGVVPVRTCANSAPCSGDQDDCSAIDPDSMVCTGEACPLDAEKESTCTDESCGVASVSDQNTEPTGLLEQPAGLQDQGTTSDVARSAFETNHLPALQTYTAAASGDVQAATYVAEELADAPRDDAAGIATDNIDPNASEPVDHPLLIADNDDVEPLAAREPGPELEAPQSADVASSGPAHEPVEAASTPLVDDEQSTTEFPAELPHEPLADNGSGDNASDNMDPWHDEPQWIVNDVERNGQSIDTTAPDDAAATLQQAPVEFANEVDSTAADEGPPIRSPLPAAAESIASDASREPVEAERLDEILPVPTRTSQAADAIVVPATTGPLALPRPLAQALAQVGISEQVQVVAVHGFAAGVLLTLFGVLVLLVLRAFAKRPASSIKNEPSTLPAEQQQAGGQVAVPSTQFYPAMQPGLMPGPYVVPQAMMPGGYPMAAWPQAPQQGPTPRARKSGKGRRKARRRTAPRENTAYAPATHTETQRELASHAATQSASSRSAGGLFGKILADNVELRRSIEPGYDKPN